MRKTILLLAVSSSLCGAASAAETKLDGAAITALLTDAVLDGVDADKQVSQIFQKSGVTFYSEKGAQSQGFWKVEGSQYCSQWPPNSSWACYDMAQDGDVVTFISASGSRFAYKRHVPQ